MIELALLLAVAAATEEPAMTAPTDPTPPALVWPEPVEPGATIGVVAPSGPIPTESLSRGLRVLREKGYRVKLGQYVRHRWHYLAGSDVRRAEDLQRIWSDQEVDAVWCVRGGYGVMRVLPYLDWELFRRRPLPLIGYSDITALQLALIAKTGLVSFSGPLLATADSYGGSKGMDPFTEAGLWLWLSPGPWPRPVANPPGYELKALRSGHATGRLVGGNLSLVAGLVGTPYLPDLNGAILVLEDVDEVPYRVDRMLTQLLLAGHFDQIAGLVLGDFAGCFPPRVKDDGPPFEELMLERLGERRIPVLSGLAYGHIRRKCTVPLGAMAELATDPPSLTVFGPDGGALAEP